MDAMRWSTEKAIYPPFVLLRSFKKANSLKALEREEDRAGGAGEGEKINPPRLRLCIKWIRLIKVARMYFINVPQMGSPEDMHAAPNEFPHERDGERAI